MKVAGQNDRILWLPAGRSPTGSTAQFSRIQPVPLTFPVLQTGCVGMQYSGGTQSTQEHSVLHSCLCKVLPDDTKSPALSGGPTLRLLCVLMTQGSVYGDLPPATHGTKSGLHEGSAYVENKGTVPEAMAGAKTPLRPWSQAEARNSAERSGSSLEGKHTDKSDGKSRAS